MKVVGIHIAAVLWWGLPSTLVAASALQVPSSLYASSRYEPLRLTLSELEDGSRQADLLTALQTTGLVAIVPESNNENNSNDNSNESVARTALQAWCTCYEDTKAAKESLLDKIPSTQSIFLEDGATKRTTLATATVGTMPLELDESVARVCGRDTRDHLEDLRDAVASVSESFVKALDVSWRGAATMTMHNSRPPLMYDAYGDKTYPTVQSIVQSATHLEHVHIYEKEAVPDMQSTATTHTKVPATTTTTTKTLDFHTDAGLFLVFVPGHDCSEQPPISDNFWIRDEQGQERPVRFPPQTEAVIMLGAGSERWLQTSGSSVNLKATQHAVQIPAGQTRAWFGKMHLVPEHAIVQTVPTTKTFGQLKEQITTTSIELVTGHRDATKLQRLSAPTMGCGTAEPLAPSVKEHSQDYMSTNSRMTGRQRRRLQHVGSPTDCNNVTNFFCWYQCIDVPDADQVTAYLSEGFSLYCLDPSVLPSSDLSHAAEPCEQGYVHNPACTGSWQPAEDGVPKTVHFANETSHHNNGLSSTHSSTTREGFCYGGTSMYMDGFHWVNEGLCVIYLFPGWILSTRTKLAVASLGTIMGGTFLEGIIWQRRRVLQSMNQGYGRLGVGGLYYGLQLTVGYLLMLVVMTYSGVLFLSTVSGLVMGNLVFNSKDSLVSSWKTKSGKTNHTDPVEAMDNPCMCGEQSDQATNVEVESGGDSDNQNVPEGATPCCQHTL